MLENWLSKSKQSCLLGFTNLLPIPVVFLPNFKFFYQTLSNSEPNFSIFLTAFGKLLPRPIDWHWRNNLKLNFSMLTRKISTVNTFGTLLLTVNHHPCTWIRCRLSKMLFYKYSMFLKETKIFITVIPWNFTDSLSAWTFCTLFESSNLIGNLDGRI